MADFTALKTAIQNAIKQNGNNAITGNLLQDILISMVSTLGDSAINGLSSSLSTETTNRQNADGTLQSAINTINTKLSDGYTYLGIATPTTNPSTTSGKVFYIATTAGTYTNFLNSSSQPLVLTQGINILKYNGTSWSVEQVWGVDDVPTAMSNNLIKSGGVQNELALGAVYDVSAKNPTAGPDNDGKWESLSALLSDANLNTLIPTSVRKGGMSIKYVCSSDNKYVQYRLMEQSFTTNTSKWQGVTEELAIGSKHLITSGGVYIKARFITKDFNCFRGFLNSSSDEPFTGDFRISDLYSCFISLKIINVQTELYAIQNIVRNYNTPQYRIILKRYNSSNQSWTNNAYTFETSTNIESGNQNGIVTFDVALQTGERLIAELDFSVFGDTTFGKTINSTVNWVIKEDCIFPNGLPDSQLSSIRNSISSINDELATVVNDSDLTIKIVSDNIANPDNIEVGKCINTKGIIGELADWAIIKVPVIPNQQLIIAGFDMGRFAYYAFYNDNTLVSTDTLQNPAGFTNPTTLTVPSGANLLYIDIATGDKVPADYDNIQINIGNILKPYDVYQERVIKINNIPLAGQTIEENGISEIVVDLPVSDGTDIQSGYAYIDSTDRCIKVKA